jgi:hypothetical protein
MWEVKETKIHLRIKPKPSNQLKIHSCRAGRGSQQFNSPQVDLEDLLYSNQQQEESRIVCEMLA